MTDPWAIWRFFWPSLMTLGIGLLAGRVASQSGASAVVLTLMGATAAFFVARARRSRLQVAVHQVKHDLATWTDNLESAREMLETIPEFDSVRQQANTTLRELQSTRTRESNRLIEIERDTRLLQNVLATMAEAVAVVDGESRLLYVNPAARRLLDLGQREVAGRLMYEFVRSPLLHALVEAVLQTGEPEATEVELTREGRIVTVAGSSLSLPTSHGAVLMLQDVTELRRLEQLRREFSSNVSHELKTPLTSIQAYADALLNSGLEDPEIGHRFVERIVQQTERMGRLIQDLLSLSRLEATPTEPREVSLTEAVEDVMPDHESVAAARGLQLHLEIPKDPVTVYAEEEGLRTLLNNLIRNALAYTPAGGEVTVRIAETPEGVRLEVSDTGIGIAREHHDRIFERFYRVDRSRSREKGGTGLGLAIVKHLVEQWSGELSFTSVPDQGTRFSIQLREAAPVSSS